MLVAWVVLVVSATPPRCPAEQQPEWSGAAAAVKRAMVRACAAEQLSAPPLPSASLPEPARAGPRYRFRFGVVAGLGATFSLTRFDFPIGLGAGSHSGGFFGISLARWLELRVLVEDLELFDIAYRRVTPHTALSLGPGLVAWVGPVGFGVSATLGVAVSNSIGGAVTALGSVRLRLGEQPRHEVALEGGMSLGLGFGGGDYLPSSLNAVARVTYTVSWGFVERAPAVALPASGREE